MVVRDERQEVRVSNRKMKRRMSARSLIHCGRWGLLLVR